MATTVTMLTSLSGLGPPEFSYLPGQVVTLDDTLAAALIADGRAAAYSAPGGGGFDLPAHSVLGGDAGGAEFAVTVAEGTLVGRLSGGVVDDLSPSAVRTLLGVSAGSGGAAPGVTYAVDDDFPGIDPLGVTDSLAGLNAWWAAVPNHGIAVVPPGRYLLSGQLVLSGKSATVVMEGVTLVGTSTSGLLQLAGSLEATQTVSVAAARKTTGGEFGAGGANMWVTDFTIPAGAPAWKKGNAVWVTADDVLTQTTATVRPGRAMIVLETSGTRATCMGTLRGSWTTNVRMARYAVDANGEHHRVVLRGGPALTWTDAVMAAAPATSYALRIRGLVEPVVDGVTVIGANGQAINVKQGTFGARIVNCRIRRADDETGTVFGYGVNDCGYRTVVDGLSAWRVRHAYTTGAGDAVTANSADLLLYGQADGFTVSNCYVEGASDSALDCHGDGIMGAFLNNRIKDSRSGIGLRGVSYVVDGLWIEGGCNGGVISADTGSSAEESYGSIIRNVTLDGITEPDNGVIFVRRTLTDGFETRPTWVDGIWLRTTDDGLAPSGAIIRADNATVEVGHLMAAMSGVSWVAEVNGGVVRPIAWYEAPVEAPEYRNSCDGTDGATVTGTTSLVGGDAFTGSLATSSGGGSRTHLDAASWVPGEAGIRCTAPAGGTGMVGWQIPSRSMRVTGQVRFSANPTVEPSRFIELKQNAGASVACAVGRTTAGLPGVKGSGVSSALSNTGASALPLGVWLSFVLTVVGDSNNTDGLLEFAIYPHPASLVPLYSVSLTNVAMGMNGADFTDIRFGKPHTAPAEGNVDLKNLYVRWDVAGV